MDRKGAMARGAASAAGLAAGLAPVLAQAAREINLQPPVTPVATQIFDLHTYIMACLLYTSPSPRDYAASRMPSSA